MTTALAEVPLKNEVSLQVQAANALDVKNADQSAAASGFIRELRKLSEKVHATMDPIVSAAHAAHRAAVAGRDEHLEPLKEAERIVKNKIGAYDEEQRRIADEQLKAAQKAAEEAERTRRQEEARIAAEEKRKAEAAVEEQRKAAAAARRAGDASRADELQAQAAQQKAEATERAAVAAEAVAAPIVVSVAAPVAIQKVKGQSSRVDWDIQITDPNKVPREWCTPDEKAIKQRVKSSDGTIAIPGVVNIKKTVVAVRK